MLVLTRQVGERIRIGEDIVLVVRHIDRVRRTVHLGIEAPRDVAIWRAELHPEKSRAVNSALGNEGSGDAV